MQYGEGIITKIYSWIWHPQNSDETVSDWIGFLALAILLSFLWTTVLRHIPEAEKIAQAA